MSSERPDFHVGDHVTLDEGTDLYRIVREPRGHGLIYTIAPVESQDPSERVKMPAWLLYAAKTAG